MRKITFTAGLLSAWSMAAVFLLLQFIPQFGVLGILFILFIVIVGLTDLFPGVAWVSCLFSTLLFAFVGYILFGFNREFLTDGLIGMTVFILTTILITTFNKQLDVLNKQYRYQNYLIDTLTVYDRRTNLMSWRFAKNALTSEIMRTKRYNGQLSVILFEIRNKNQYTPAEIYEFERVIADILQDVIRKDIDIPFIGNRIGLILPERDLIYTQAFTDQVLEIMGSSVHVPISAGIANFPQDADSTLELVDRAEIALRRALEHGLPSYQYQSFSSPAVQPQMPQPVDLSKDITQPVDLATKRSPYQDYAKILRNIPLSDRDWVLWLQGFTSMEDLRSSDNNLLSINHILQTEFLFVQENHIVLKIKTRLPDLLETTYPFPGWEILKSNPQNNYIILRQI